MAHPKLTLFAARLLQDDRSASTSVYCGKVRHGAAVLFTVLILIVCVAASKLSFGQWMGKQTGCYADSIAANPNRPTVSNPAHVTQYGVLELEYGWDWLWPEDVIRENSFGGLLKFGMLCDIELRWNTTSFLSQTDATGTCDSHDHASGMAKTTTGRTVSVEFSAVRVTMVMVPLGMAA